jgi:hypothetical protein
MMGGAAPGGAPGGLDAAMPPDMGGGMPPDMGGAPPDMGGLDAAMGGQPPGFATGGAIYRYASGTGSTGVDTGAALQALFGGVAAAPVGPSALQASLQPISYDYPEVADPYSGLRDLYSKQLGEIEKEKERAAALALISAGVGIAGGKSQNFARNLAGSQDAIKNYSDTLGTLDERGQAIMRGRTNLDFQSQARLDDMKKNFPDTQEGRRQMVVQTGLDTALPEVQSYIATGENSDLAFGIGGKYSKGFIEGENVKTKEPVWARYNESKKQYEDADGNPIPFREYSTEEVVANKNRAAELAKDKLLPSEYLKTVNSASDIQTNTERVNGQVAQAANLVRSGKVNGVFQMTEAAPGPQRELANLVSTLKSNAAINAMRRLRETSTGGTTGFGQLTQNEFKALEDSLTALDRFNDPEAFMRQLEIYQNSLMQMYRKAAIYLNQTLEDNPEVRKPKFESEMGLVLDLNNVDNNIGEFTKAFTGEPNAPGGNDTGVSLAPPVPERDLASDIFKSIFGF